MSWLGLLLICFALTDLIFSVRPARRVPEVAAVIFTVSLGLLLGLTETADVVALLTIGVCGIAWGHCVTNGFIGRLPPWVPLAVFAAAVTVAFVAQPSAGAVHGPIAQRLGDVLGTDPSRAVLILGAGLIQLSTGNVLVRLVLSATGTINPARADLARTDAAGEPPTQLKGGRLLGPLERIFIFGLGLSGNYTAAAIVIAAKGLLRFPELSTRKEQDEIHQLSEYFLLGSFMSWLVALGALYLAG